MTGVPLTPLSNQFPLPGDSVLSFTVLGNTSFQKRVVIFLFQWNFCRRLQSGATSSRSRQQYPAQGLRTSTRPKVQPPSPAQGPNPTLGTRSEPPPRHKVGTRFWWARSGNKALPRATKCIFKKIRSPDGHTMRTRANKSNPL